MIHLIIQNVNHVFLNNHFGLIVENKRITENKKSY